MANHEAAHAHRTADDEYLEVPGSSYEHTDANVWAIVKFGIWLIITALVVHVGIGVMYGALVEGAKEPEDGRRYPLVSAGAAALPPEPRLQESPSREIERFRADEERRLHEYGWVNKEQGVVHIPIDDAMRLLMERGLPTRPADAANAAPGGSMLASDASAGRVMERRRQ